MIWVLKYRFKILTGKIGQEVETCIRTFSAQLNAETVKLNVQIDHIHLLVLLPPKISVSKFMGVIKGRTAIKVLNTHISGLKIR